MPSSSRSRHPTTHFILTLHRHPASAPTMLALRLARPSRGRCLARTCAAASKSTTGFSSAASSCRPRFFSQSSLRRHPAHEDAHDRLRHARPLVPHAAAARFATAGRTRNIRTVVVVAVLGAVAFYLYNSQTVPVTGRRRFNFLSDKLVERAHSRAKDDVIQSVEAQGGHFLSEWDPRTILVKRVMRKLIPVSGLPELDWEIRVISDNGRRCSRLVYCHSVLLSWAAVTRHSPAIVHAGTANAFVLPGGKVFVHSGLLSVCRNEDALAAVLGHEIAHNTASHVAERLSAAWVGNLTAGSVFFLAGRVAGPRAVWPVELRRRLLPAGSAVLFAHGAEAGERGGLHRADDDGGSLLRPAAGGGVLAAGWRRFRRLGDSRRPRC